MKKQKKPQCMHFGAFKGFGSRREAALIREKTETGVHGR